MIGLDTNVLIRYIVQDDEQQAPLATDVIENQCSIENPAFINEVDTPSGLLSKLLAQA